MYNIDSMNDRVILKASAVVSALSGAIILFTTIYPIVSYENAAAKRYPSLIKPVVDKNDKSSGKMEAPSTIIDYTKPQNWFVGAEYNTGETKGAAFYTIGVPRLNIADAIVQVGGEDLSKSLIQYPGTANPGKIGNSVIFGHSILPQYYDPKNYLSIFSLLPSLVEGDVVSVKYDGVVYKYQVETLFEVLPEDIQILEQQTDASYLTLVTCVPPGHPLKPKRLIVRARLIK